MKIELDLEPIVAIWLFQKCMRLLILNKIDSAVSAKTGVGKLFVRRATFEKNVAAKGRTLSLQNRKFTLCVKKTHLHIKHSFCISHSGTLNAIYTVIVRT